MNSSDTVIRLPHHTHAISRWHDEKASQIVEFAVSLPLLVLFVVGIYDFSGAFTLKQKLTNIARDTARIAAADPANDLVLPTTALPVSVTDAYQALTGYLTANKIANCGLTAPGAPSGLTWTFSSSGPSCTVGVQTFTINRGYYFSSLGGTLPAATCASGSIGRGNLAVISTCVSIQYAYQWQFGRVASLIGSTTALPASITVTAVAMNEN